MLRPLQRIRDSHQLVAKNFFWLGLSRVVQILINLTASVIIARYLKVELFGRYTFIFATATIFDVLLSGGFCTVVMREVARDKNRVWDYYFSTLVVQLLIVVITFLSVPTIVWFVYKDKALLWASLIISCSMSLRSVHAIGLSVFRSLERMAYELQLTMIGRVSYLLLLLVAISLRWKIAGIFSALLAAQIAQTSWGIYLLRKKVVCLPNARINWERMLIFREGCVISANAFLTNMTFKVHTFLLKAISGDFAVGIFSVIIRLMEQGKLAPRVLLVSLFPRFCRLGVSDKDRLRWYLLGLLGLTVAICLPVAVILYFSAEWIVTFLYGQVFLPSAKVLEILSIAVLLIPINIIFHYIYIAMNQQNLVTIFLGIAILFHIALGILFIPGYGYSGASWAFAGGETVSLILNSAAFFKLFGLKRSYRE